MLCCIHITFKGDHSLITVHERSLLSFFRTVDEFCLLKYILLSGDYYITKHRCILCIKISRVFYTRLLVPHTNTTTGIKPEVQVAVTKSLAKTGYTSSGREALLLRSVSRYSFSWIFVREEYSNWAVNDSTFYFSIRR